MTGNNIVTVFLCTQFIFGAEFISSDSDSENSIQIHFSQGSIQYTLSGDYTRISSGKSGTTTDLGMPELPLYSTMVQVRPDREYEIHFTVLQSSVLSDVTVFPFQDESETENPGTVNHLNDSFYSGEALYPESIIYTSERLIMRDLHVLNIQVIPFRFYPSTRELEIIESMDITVSETESREYQNSSTRQLSKAFEPLYSNFVVNYENQTRDEGYQKPAILYICGGNSQNNSSFQQLVNWRHKRGYVVYIASLSETGSSTGAIKNYIQDAYETFDPPPEFIGIFGDVGGTYNVPTFDECWGHDWGGCEGDFPYTQLDGNDFLPEVFVGRISVSSSSHIATIVNKITHYEKATYMSTMSGFYERAALVGDPSSSGVSTIITNEYVENIMDSFEVEDVRTNYGQGGYSSWMRDQLEEGVLYMNYRGYVGVSGFGSSQINNANNGHKLPFATFLTCGTGDFAGTSISESFLRAGTVSNPKGGIASVGTATLSTHTMFNNIVAMGIYDGVFSHGLETTGASVAHGKLVMYNTYPTNPSDWVSAFTQWNNLMGDPATHLWTDTPETIQLIFNDSIPIGTNIIDVKVLNNGIPVENAMVTLLKGNDEIFLSDYSDAGGNVDLPIDSFVSEGDMSITVTKRNYKPYEDTIFIYSTGTIANYDPSLEIEINELTGNNDGILNPGETVHVQIPIRNYGQLDISGVYAELSTESELVTLIETSSFYEFTLGTGETSYGAGFSFILSPSAEEMEDLKLRIYLFEQSNAILGEGSVAIPISGTKLRVSGYELLSGSDDTLEPGVASEMRITLVNEGSISTTGLMGGLNFYGSAIQIYDGDGYWNPVQGGAEQVSSDWFTVHPSINVINGSVYNMTLWIQTAGGFNREFSFPVYVGEVSEGDPLGPDEYGYYLYDSGDDSYDLSPAYDWIEISPSSGGSGTNLNLSDSGYGNFSNSIEQVDLPFPFSYYGVTYETITVCSNGFIAFGESELESFRNYSIPGAGGPSPMVAVFWDDLTTTSNGDVYIYADPDNEYFIVEWSNMRTENYNSVNTFELILYNESAPPFGDGVMKMQYHTFNNTSSGNYSGYTPRHGGHCTVGLENHLGSVGLQYTFDNGYAPAAMELNDETAILVTTQPTINMTEVAVPIELDENWNLLGLPADVDNGDYTLLFPDAIENTLYSFDEGYQLVDEMEIGNGYWLRFPESDMHLITGIRVDELALELIEGWNLISGISFDISLNAVVDPGDILVPNTLYGFGTNGYQGSDELTPGKGYWLRAYESGPIFLSTGAVARTAETNLNFDDLSWININGQKLYFDIPVAEKDILQFSLPPKPPSGAFDVRFEGDWKLCNGECVIEIMSQEDLQIDYQLFGEEWVLTDINSGQEFILNPEGSSVSFTVEPTSHMSLRKKGRVVPETFSLYPAFPNPFNPETTLRFFVPRESQFITLNIINVRGQMVKTLVSGEVSYGAHTISWDGTDLDNKNVSAGIYFSILSYDSGTKIQKMIMLK
ncbi:MAG TPA: C25 family cysteine peptidase [Candidatus Marinimicrobia bacterium]|nr:C25 family cysteine peptidase [Candidatus Neomarinimicrobiota bacterium]